ENVTADIVQSKFSIDTVDTGSDSASAEGKAFDFAVNEITLKNIQGRYNHRAMGQSASISLDELFLAAENIDLKNRSIKLNEFRLHNTIASYHQLAGYQVPATQTADTTSNPANKPWSITLGELDLSNNSIQYYNFDKPFEQGIFDANHLWITKLNLQADDLAWEGLTMKGDLSNLAFQERSGFIVESFSAAFSITEKSIDLKNFKFKSPNSKIAISAEGKFESFKTISETYDDAFIDLLVQESEIGLADVYYFAPTLFDSLPVRIPSNTTLRLDTKINGQLKNLNIDRFVLQTLSKTYLSVRGKLQLPRTSDPYFQLELEKFYTTKNDIELIVPDTLIPPSISLPQWLNIKAKGNGTAASPTIDASISTDLGDIALNAALESLKATGKKTKYKGTLNINGFQTGKLLKQEKTLGALTMGLSVEGSGLTMDDLDTKVKLRVDSFAYQGYTYKSFTLDGTLKQYFFSGNAAFEDENLKFKLDGDLDYNGEVPKYAFTFALENADFKALHLSDRALKARGTVDVDLATSDFKVINGRLDIRKFAIFNGKDMYAVDSLLFASIDQEGQSEIEVRSDIVDADFQGTINLYSLSEVVRRHFNNYFSLHDTTYNQPTAPQNFKFSLKIKNTDLLTEIILPDLDPFVPGEIKGAFDSNDSRLDLNIDLAKIRYAGVGTDSISFDVTSDENALSYTLAVRKIQMDSIRIEAVKLQGDVANDSIRTKFVILDSLQKDKYVFGGVFNSLEKVFQFRFLKDQIIMNYAPWSAPADNTLQFTSKGIRAHNFSFTNINENISLKTTNDQDSIVTLQFKDLNLQNITKLVEGATPVDGLANGTLNMMSSEKGAFNSELRIDSLSIMDHTWGNLALALGKTSAGPLNIDLNLEGKGTSLEAGGYYSSDPTAPEINFTANILRFDLVNIEPFTIGQLKNTKGQLKGDLKVSGSPTSPDIEGNLNFEKASFTPSMANTEFTLNDESITFSNNQISITDFEITDKHNNTAKIDGKILTEGFQKFNLDLGLTATDFQVLHSTEKDNELFYGSVKITTKAKVSGDLNQPVVDVNIKLSDDSNFTFVVPQSEKGVLEQKGIVKWVDRDAKNDPFLASLKPQDTIKSAFKGIDLSANVELNGKETFNIIIDPLTGDKLSVKGNATLTLDQHPSGDMVLTGRYEINEGTYDFSFYKIIKRKFSIEKGSTILWSGEPIEASLDLRAIYEVEASPIELIQTTDEETLNKSKQRLPFLVYLQIKGDMLAPEISFKIDMRESERNALNGAVYAKIQDINTRESELNKQVFALLILQRFVSENPLENQAAADVSNTARQSVSRIMTDQLNRLSENVKGVELTFDVKSYEDYSSGSAQGQTQVQLGVQKTLLDDRLIVKVSGNFDVEGEASNQNSASDYIGDLALEYKLTEDGRFRITGFRNSNY
ncbi:MAG TPA: translocation/assembly module TamB domain-containing protein, partial [Chryseolinea sp.]|nr:translocation/assembly module TamB domain-containing protein [Chryseolinea sp.]